MPLFGACCKLRWCEPAKARVWPCGVVVDTPSLDDPAGLGEIGEQVLVEAFVAQPAVEQLDEAVLGRLSRRDVVPLDALVLLPAKDCPLRQFGAVVTDHHARPTTPFHEAVELASDTEAR